MGKLFLDQIRNRYLRFFEKENHVIIPSSSLVPENDPTTLFTGSGMQPLVPYLLGKEHPAGKRLANSQKCFRAEDIDEVGDNRHTTFFEMLGNWSLGDYWKEEQLKWCWEFLTKEIGIASDKLWVTYFEGDNSFSLPPDNESAGIWEKLGIPKARIKAYGVKKNWWSRSGTPENMPEGDPGGPDSEIFYDFGAERGLHENSVWKDKSCHPNCDCGRFMEIGNSVFMEYRRTASGFEKLPRRNVDFGGGLERIAAAVSDEPDMFKLDVFQAAIKNLEDHTDKKYDDEVNKKSYRIILDHIRAAVFLIADGVMPANVDRGYFVRRLLRRAILHLDKLGLAGQIHGLLDAFVGEYEFFYGNFHDNKRIVEEMLNQEERQFRKTLKAGLKRFGRLAAALRSDDGEKILGGTEAFYLYQTFGFPKDLMEDLCVEKGIRLDESGFAAKLQTHKQISRAGAEKKFRGGLADGSDKVVQYHTATHLLHQALRDVLGNEVRQKGSNITAERLRFDFSFPRKLTTEEITSTERIVNEKIAAKMPVSAVTLPLEEAKKSGALHFFDERYPEKVLIHYIGDSLETAYSKEFCGGPHVKNTADLKGWFKIIKEEAVSAGVRRIKAVFWNDGEGATDRK